MGWDLQAAGSWLEKTIPGTTNMPGHHPRPPSPTRLDNTSFSQHLSHQHPRFSSPRDQALPYLNATRVQKRSRSRCQRRGSSARRSRGGSKSFPGAEGCSPAEEPADAHMQPAGLCCQRAMVRPESDTHLTGKIFKLKLA